MLQKVQSNFQTNYNTSFQAKMPDKKLIVSCYNGKDVIIKKSEFDKYIKRNDKPKAKYSLKDILFEMFPGLDAQYQTMMKK